ncbi:hypothetical protein [Variovorax terrae]|uniref:Uncharacterized protein n=1 Tax=Variovorax terrae TaxID=2923278 RepID=A0A9X1VRT0_9BURK|nr:hypothetical protein [Variovorax terrae]MCJ0762646.1 hypothetical protein [Variovorax terrae]
MIFEKPGTDGELDVVSSYRVGFTCTTGAIDSVCIKYTMRDGICRLSYWPLNVFQEFLRSIEYYSESHYDGSDLQRASEDSEYARQLPARHPVHTLNNERPELTQEDYFTARDVFYVASLAVADQGDAICTECTFANGTRRVEVLPAYIAMNLCGAMKASVDLSGLVGAKPGGTA